MTRALILAAGQGTRLRPITDDKPKCLVPFLGRSLLGRQIDTLKELGVNDIHISAGYRADQIVALGFVTSINRKFATTNMVESLFSALSFIKKKGDLIIAYGDIVYQSNNLQALLNCDDEIALIIDARWRDLWCLRFDNPLDDAETLIMNDDGYVTELGKKPESYDQIEGQYTGLLKIRSDKLEAMVAFYNKLDRFAIYDGKDFNNMYMTSFLQLLVDSGWEAKAVLVKNGWLEIDSEEDLEKYEAMAKEGKLDRFYKVEN